MSVYEIGAICISSISLVVAIFSMCWSTKISKRANEISQYQNNIIQGQAEQQIHQCILETKKDFLELALKISNGNEEMIKSAFAAASESYVNAYEQACAQYLDKKIDTIRFKKSYYLEIKQLVEDEYFKEKFDAVSSKYKAILKVYKEWNDLERHLL